MKKHSTLIWAFVSAMAALAIVACGKSGGSSSNPAPAPVAPLISPGLPPGQKIGFFAQNSRMDYYFNNGGSSFTLQSGMNNVLKYAMRVCDRGAYNGGSATCQAFLSGFNDIMLFADGSQVSKVKLVIRSKPDTTCTNPSFCSTYWYSLPSFQQVILGYLGLNTFNNSYVYDPLIMDMTIWPVNNSQGFELRGYAPGNDLYYGSGNLLFQFQVPNGKLEDAAWDYQLVFNGEVAASGRMVRCQTETCGMQAF